MTKRDTQIYNKILVFGNPVNFALQIEDQTPVFANMYPFSSGAHLHGVQMEILEFAGVLESIPFRSWLVRWEKILIFRKTDPGQCAHAKINLPRYALICGIDFNWNRDSKSQLEWNID